ncbi:hypothetical protein FSY45_24165 [Comamonas sp. Z1]|uniref:SRPBCC family protein n=1 Tax=Comamonas TaxID=283 RepID=UPI0006B885DF|nr:MULTISPECIES: SRPBCC family protein [Comamonas]TYK71025.1 hypothetical protein FSY45_24165 [Comamonas sp. Z1]TYK73376.1 hypothetical protein FSY59_01740 [Comamonas sp. Z3]
MNFSYQFELPVPVERAWATLMDIPRVAPCMPGATIESSDGNNHIGKVRVKLGPIELTYRGAVTLVERDDAQHQARVNVVAKEIKGAGAAKAELTLAAAESSPGTTKVSVSSEFSISGKAAQFGRGVVDEVAAVMMGQFAERLSRLLQQPDAAPAPAPVTTAAVAAAPALAVASAPLADTTVAQQSAPSIPQARAIDASMAQEMQVMFIQMLNATTAAANAATAAANAASAAASALASVHARVGVQSAGSFNQDNDALDMGNVMGAVLYRRLKWVALAGVAVIAVGAMIYMGGRN